MSIAAKDNNRKPTLTGVSDSDGLTILRLYVDPTAHYIKTSDGTTGSDYGTPDAQKDLDYNSCLMGVSSADGKTPVAIYIDHTNNSLKIKSS
jgi:hypothetical protein